MKLKLLSVVAIAMLFVGCATDGQPYTYTPYQPTTVQFQKYYTHAGGYRSTPPPPVEIPQPTRYEPPPMKDYTPRTYGITDEQGNYRTVTVQPIN